VPDGDGRRAHPMHRVVEVSRLQQVARHEVHSDASRGDLAFRRGNRVECEGLKWSVGTGSSA
jgi:hypothetical protein